MFNFIKKMTNIASTLKVKASGSIDESIAEDLKQPEGKSIAELINEQETNQAPQTPPQCE